ncbi:sigma factor-like helix-turn-helix DNA-binding protein [Tistrella bauzanensis]
MSDIALPEPGGIEAAETLSLALLRLMERLPPSERAALLLVEVAEMSPAEAAAALGIRDASLRQRLSRARRRLAAARAELPALADPCSTAAPAARRPTRMRRGGWPKRCWTRWPPVTTPPCGVCSRPMWCWKAMAAARLRRP